MTNPTDSYLRAMAAFGSWQAKFLLKHGRAFEPDLLTFRGWLGEPKNCFGNAARVAVTKDPTLTYVEGYVTAAIPIHHAWLVRDDGSIIDPTLRLDGRVGPEPHAYFGVPFDTDYVRRFILRTGTFGLLDGMSKASRDLMASKVKPSKFIAKSVREAACA